MGDSYNIEKIYKYLFYLQNLIVMQVINYFYYKNKNLEIKNSKDNI